MRLGSEVRLGNMRSLRASGSVATAATDRFPPSGSAPPVDHASACPPTTVEPSIEENGHSIDACGSTDWLETGLPMSTSHAGKMQPSGSPLVTTLLPICTFSGTLPLP